MQSNQSCKNIQSIEVDEVPVTIKEYNDITHIQQKILSMVAAKQTTAEIFNQLCFLAEKLLTNSVASIMLMDKETGLMSVLSAPSVPPVGHEALSNLKPGPKGGSCGNAVFHNEAQYVQNTFEDPRWENLRPLAIDFNLCSCWSMPIQDEENSAIGSFALSSFEHRKPSNFHKLLLETGASIIKIVLQNQKAKEKIQLFTSALENASEGMFITDANNKIVEVNQAFEKIYGYKQKDVLKQNPNFLASGEHDKNFFNNMWIEVNEKSKWSGEVTNKKSDGSLITQWMSITAFYDENNQIKNYLAVFTDLTELTHAQNRLEYMAYHDSLTNLYNKSFFEKITRTVDKKSLILLNIDNFSYINTAYGFETADSLLKKLSEIFLKHFSSDTVFRFNVDEFALLYNDEINLEKKIKEIQKYFSINSIKIDQLELNISFSYGAIYSNKNLLRNSASALKLAKENGKNRFYIFNEEEHTLDYSKREAFIKSSNLVRNAIEHDTIVPYFQGIYDNETNEITKYEALVRIEEHNEVISPYYFLEVAKLSGLLPSITKIMIDKTFNMIKTRKRIEFSINVTEDDLIQNYLVEYIKDKSIEHGINLNQVTLEILEGISSTGKKNHIHQLNTLKKMGIKIAIDDFGTEYSNFERILDLDVDCIKIDAKYIKDIHTNQRSYEITRALVFFAQNVDILCVAEFVHNKEVQDIVKELGIRYSQGYYFSQPRKELIN